MKKTSLYPEINYQFVILGNYGNGKTSYLIRLALDQFDPDKIVTTVGVDFTDIKKKFQYDSHYHKATIWDTSGQQQFKSISGNHIRNSIGAFIALTLQYYEESQFKQFQKKTKQQLKEWIKFVQNKAQSKNYAYHIIGTKLDYVTLQRRKQIESILREMIKQVISQLQNEEVPIKIDSSLFDYSVISAKLQVTTKQEIQNVLLKLIKTKYQADKKSGGRQQKFQGIKKLKRQKKDEKGADSKINNRGKCC